MEHQPPRSHAAIEDVSENRRVKARGVDAQLIRSARHRLHPAQREALAARGKRLDDAACRLAVGTRSPVRRRVIVTADGLSHLLPLVAKTPAQDCQV